MGGKKTNHVRKLLRSFGAVRNWQLILILIPLLFVTATLLRLDHLRMSELRKAVIEADQNDDDPAIKANLEKLHAFVVSHVVFNVVESNGRQSVVFGTGPFYLEGEYRRAAEAAIEKAEAELANDANPNGDIYAAVMNICRPQALANGWAWNNPNYLRCWTDELGKYPASDNLEVNLTAQVPNTELFRQEFSSPIWAPSWAGWAMLACAVIGVIILVRILIWCVLKVALFFLRKT